MRKDRWTKIGRKESVKENKGKKIKEETRMEGEGEKG